MSIDLQNWLREIHGNAERDSFSVSFNVYDNNKTVEEISELLELIPTNYYRDGDTLFKNEKFDVKCEGSSWTLSSRLQIRSKDMELHLNWIFNQLFGKLPAIRKLQAEGATMRLIARADSWSRYTNVELSTETLQFLAQLRVRLTCETYYMNSNSEY